MRIHTNGTINTPVGDTKDSNHPSASSNKLRQFGALKVSVGTKAKLGPALLHVLEAPSNTMSATKNKLAFANVRGTVSSLSAFQEKHPALSAFLNQ